MHIIKIEFNLHLYSVTLYIIQCRPKRKKGQKHQEGKKVKNRPIWVDTIHNTVSGKWKKEEMNRFYMGDTIHNTTYIYIYSICFSNFNAFSFSSRFK